MERRRVGVLLAFHCGYNKLKATKVRSPPHDKTAQLASKEACIARSKLDFAGMDMKAFRLEEEWESWDWNWPEKKDSRRHIRECVAEVQIERVPRRKTTNAEDQLNGIDIKMNFLFAQFNFSAFRCVSESLISSHSRVEILSE